MDLFSMTWNIHGARFSDTALLIMSASIGEGQWYRFSKGQSGVVIVDTKPQQEVISSSVSGGIY